MVWMPRTDWTNDELTKLKRWRDVDKCSWKEIAMRLGRSESGTSTKYYSSIEPKFRKRRTQRVIFDPDMAAYEDRDQRNVGREQQDTTASFFGDPPFGFSALDQMRRAAAKARQPQEKPTMQAGRGTRRCVITLGNMAKDPKNGC